MTFLSNAAVRRLTQAASWPDTSATRYEILEVLGRGGMGTVYLAQDRELMRPVALKVLDLPEAGAEAGARLLREARIIARLEHPGIVPVHDVGTLPDGRVYYAMKRVVGRRLDEVARQEGSLAVRLRIFERVCEAVAFAHSRDVIHRDLKPENVMVGTFGEVLVMDWGVAKLPDEAAATGGEAEPRAQSEIEGTGHGAVVGTPGYMAPEQARGESGTVDVRADVYALGGMLRFIAGPGSPRRLEAVARKALAEAPADRYPRVEELAADVAAFLAGDPVSAYPETGLERLRRVAFNYRAPLLLVLAYLLMRVVLIVLERR